MKLIYIIILSVLVSMLAMAGCSSMSISEKETKRAELDAMAAMAIEGLVEQDATLQQKIDGSLGYVVANMKVTKIPIVGAGGGEGVFINNKTQKRSYFTVSRFDIGGGWGVRSYKVLMVIDQPEMMERLRGGVWEFKAGAEASAGTTALEGSADASNEGYTVHVLADGGASATVTARVIRVKVNSELTDD